MLRKIRVSFAILFFVLITLLFLDFTGTVPHVVRLDGKDTVFTGAVGIEFGGRCVACPPDVYFRTHLLFGNLSARCVSGYYIMDGRKAEEESFSLF